MSGEASDKATAALAEQVEANLQLDEVTGEKVSKSELKRRQKQRQREEEKAKKAAAAPPKPATSKKKDDEEEMDPRMYYENRSKAIKTLLETNSPNPYPHKFHVNYDDKQFVKDYEHIKVCASFAIVSAGQC